MKDSIPYVISASRRTDIPAFYMDWFMHQLKQGFFVLTNPYNKRQSTLHVSKDHVHCIVFWSKNYGPFIKHNYGKHLNKLGYKFVFHFTINSSSLLEPQLPSLNNRLDQLKILCEEYSPDSIYWRFDPICFYMKRHSNGFSKIYNNLNQFEYIAEVASNNKITRCIISFMRQYPKISRRISNNKIPIQFVSLSQNEKLQLLSKMEQRLISKQIRLLTCCEKNVLSLIPNTTIKPATCISHHHLMQVMGGSLSLKKDHGQRVKEGCNCQVSKDIGSYDQRCFHRCLYCYAR